jgi:phospholipase/carboxylesterase
LLEPDRFAGVVSVGGPLPKEHSPLAQVQRARRLPVLIAHGRDSESYLTDEVCQDLRLLYSAGMSVTLRQYPCPQEVTTQMLSDADAWIMERVTGGGDAQHRDAPRHHISDWN